MFRLIAPAVILALLLAMNVDAQGKKPARPHNDAKDTYAVTQIEGWKVRISARYEEHDETRAAVLDEVRSQLRRITMLVRPEPLAELRKVEIWVEYDYPDRCQYHPGEQWLVANGYIPEKVKTIEIANARRARRTRCFTNSPTPFTTRSSASTTSASSRRTATSANPARERKSSAITAAFSATTLCRTTRNTSRR